MLQKLSWEILRNVANKAFIIFTHVTPAHFRPANAEVNAAFNAAIIAFKANSTFYLFTSLILTVHKSTQLS